MKKLLSFALAIMLIVTMSVTAFAASPETNNGTKDTSINVSGKYTAASDSGATISVIVAWDDMNFTYEAGGNSNWNTTSHKYDTTTAAGWKDESKEITVTNHSDTAVTAAFSFAGNNGIKGNFTNGSVELVSANTEPYAGTTNAPSGKTSFSIDKSSPAISAETDLGTITVTITETKYTVVNDATALETALQAGGNIKLGSNIDVVKTIIVESENTVVLDLNGKTLTMNGELTLQNVTVKDSVGGGSITLDGNVLFIEGNFTMESGRINGEVFAYKDCNISGGTLSNNDDVSLRVYESLTMTGGEISGSTAVRVMDKNIAVNISGGSIKGSPVAFELYDDVANTCTLTVTGGTVEGYCEVPNINVAGGTVKGDLASDNVIVTDGEVTGALNGKLYVRGGTVTIEGGYLLEMEVTGGTLTITGGKFRVDPTTYVDTDVYNVETIDDLWTVSKK